MPLPVHNFATPEVKPRTGEHYVSEASNLKFLGQPRGVYLGFNPQTVAGSLVLTLTVDPVFGISFARVRSNIDVTNVDVATEQSVMLDFTGHDFLLNPTVHVKVRANSKIGSPTTAEVFTTGPGPVPANEALICVVTKPGANLVADATAPANRTTPYAFATAPLGYGFMRESAVEQLLACVLMVAEVIAARVDLLGVNHPYNPPFDFGLHDRIIADLLPAAIAGRLGLAMHVVRSQDYLVGSTTDIINVSSSFAAAGRTRAPIITIPANGSETVEGAITDPSDVVRNTCFIQVVGTGERPIDADRLVSFGRLVYLELSLSGILTFSNVSTTVTGVGTLFTTEIAIGDIIQAPDGEFYVVTAIANDFSLTLTTIPTLGGAISSTRRRFELRVRKNDTGIENPLAISGGSTVRFFFPTWLDLGSSIHDATLMMFEGGEEPPLPAAAVGVQGKAIMYPGVTDALGGAVNSVTDAGSPVGTGVPVYAMNFDSAVLGAPGIANITAAGPTGPTGAPGTPGSPGPSGPQGLGFDTYSTPFSNSAIFDPMPGAWGANIVLSYTATFAGPPKFVHGGMSRWGVTGGTMDFNDHFVLDSVLISGSMATVRMRTPNFGVFPNPPVGVYQLFLNAAG